MYWGCWKNALRFMIYHIHHLKITSLLVNDISIRRKYNFKGLLDIKAKFNFKYAHADQRMPVERLTYRRSNCLGVFWVWQSPQPHMYYHSSAIPTVLCTQFSSSLQQDRACLKISVTKTCLGFKIFSLIKSLTIGGGQKDLWKSLPTQNILWFYYFAYFLKQH